MNAVVRDEFSSGDRRYASRKFLLACAAFLAGLVLLALGKITSQQWVDFTQWIVGLYMVGNIGDTVAEGLKT